MDHKTWIRDHFDEEVAALQGLLRIKSVEALGEDGTPFGRGAQDCLDYVLRLGAEMGFRPTDLDGRCGWLDYGEGEELVVVLGHLDVVPEGTGWTHDPYGAEIADGRIYARGAIDDKGPMMAALYALKSLAATGEKLGRRVRILFGLNEETGCACMKHYVKSGQELPALGFTPDGDFPIINGEKGIFSAHYAVTLPEDGRLLSFRGGTALNMVPANAEAELDTALYETAVAHAATVPYITVARAGNQVCVAAQGRSAHGSTPEKGENAISRLAGFLAQLPLAAEEKAAMEAIARRYPRETNGEGLGIYLQDEVSGWMTVNLGTAELQGRTLNLGVNLRVPVTYGEDDFHPALTVAMLVDGFRETDSSFTPPLYIPADTPLIRTLQKVYADETGDEPTLLAIGGGTYAKTMPNIVAFGPIFPGEPAVEHEPDEYIALESLRRCTEIYAAAIKALANA